MYIITITVFLVSSRESFHVPVVSLINHLTTQRQCNQMITELTRLSLLTIDLIHVILRLARYISCEHVYWSQIHEPSYQIPYTKAWICLIQLYQQIASVFV